MAYRPRARWVMAPVFFVAALAGGGVLLQGLGASAWWAAPGAAILTVVQDAALRPWLERRQAGGQADRAAVAALRAHMGRRGALPLVTAADPLRLGVHRAVALPEDTVRLPHDPQPDPYLPTWVERGSYPALIRWLREEAAARGGFLLIVGDSSVGKTRLAYEAVREALPRFALLHPDDAALVTEVADATFRLPRLVIWLDELERYLVEPQRTLTLPVVRRLLESPTPVVLVGTLWPETYSRLVAQGPDRTPAHPAAHAVLTFPGVNRLFLETFDAVERAAAERLARTDGRMAAATADRRHGVTEVLAGGPATVWRWQEAPSAAKAVITAAIDAHRIGLRVPLTAELLCALARAYLPAPEEDDAWFTPALAEVTTVRRSDGVMAPLARVADSENRRTVGHVVSDFLLQHGIRTRADVPVPEPVWGEIARRVTDPDELCRAAATAEQTQPTAAEALYRSALHAGSAEARTGLAALLVARDRLAEAEQLLRTAIADGHPEHRGGLAYLLEWQGRIDEAAETWRETSAAGDPDGRRALTDLFHAHRRAADAGRLWLDAVAASEPRAHSGLADHLELCGDTEAAERAWRAAVEAGEPGAVIGLADQLGHQGRTAEQSGLWSQALTAGPADVYSAKARWRERSGSSALDDWHLAVQFGDHLSTPEWSRLLRESTNLLYLPAMAASMMPGPVTPGMYDHFRHIEGVHLHAALVRRAAAAAAARDHLDLMLFLVGAEQRMRGAGERGRAGLAELVRVRQRLAAGPSSAVRQVVIHHQLVRDARHGRAAETVVGYLPVNGMPMVMPVVAVRTTCPGCGSAVADMSRPFCPDCGARLDQPRADRA
ncbi:hypothetical protein [Streptomyces sp. NPDC005408]|uniref:tetratricopeptide repeat protein n=1 Tax=Streptomyces sp. NPDC005408 TaxID=3155341 RepID=UPI0033A21523